jgi:RNA polymerase-associated protein RTF1
MSDFEDDIDDQLLELAGATEKKKKRRQPSGGNGAGAGSNGKSGGASKKRRAECVLFVCFSLLETPSGVFGWL